MLSLKAAVTFKELYALSKARLAPLSDPLETIFHLHRQLKTSREEVYSDWFQWVLQELNDGAQVAYVLGLGSGTHLRTSDQFLEIIRELKVAHGHQNQSGRLDLLISQNGESIAAVEVKTQSYEDFDLQKHGGYRKSFSNADHIDWIFLAIEPPETEDTANFRFLAWRDVCIHLRRIVVRRLAPEQILGSALILCFVGAVEQNLLGFRPPEAFLQLGVKLPRIVDHFAEALKDSGE